MTVEGTADAEPNDQQSEANEFAYDDTVYGRIGYGSVAVDIDDYFMSVLPDDGSLALILEYNNTSNSTGSDLWVYAYNKAGGLINSHSLVNQALGEGRDTLRLYCRSSDTIYFRIRSSGCFSYRFYYTMNALGRNDTGDNNSMAKASLIDLDSMLSGRIGYLSVATDYLDYYKFELDGYIHLKAGIQYVNTSNSAGSDFMIRLYNEAGSVIFSRNYFNTSIGEHVEMLDLGCIGAGTVFLEIRSSGCFVYNIDFEEINAQPSARIEHTRVGNQLGFEAIALQSDSIYWDFDDGSTSTLRFPAKEFDIGVYLVQLHAYNEVCDIEDIDTLVVEIAGVEYYTPHEGGSGGDVMMQVFGGGLDTGTSVILRKGATEIYPSHKYGTPLRDELQLIFDLHLAEEGMYDVVINIDGEPEVIYPNGFEVGTFRYPFAYSDIIGPNRWRINRDTRFILSVENRGNVKASGVLTTMIWPKSVDVEFQTQWFRPPDSGSYTIETEDTVFHWKWEDVQVFYDSAFSAPVPIDSLAGKPYDGYFLIIMIPNIAAGSSYELPFIARTSKSGTPSFYTYTSRPNIFGSPSTMSWGDQLENMAVEGIDLIDMGLGAAKMDKTPLGWLAKATKATTIHMANLGQAMGAAYNYLDGTNNSIYESLPANYMSNVSAGNSQIASEIIGLATDKLIEGGADRIMRNQTIARQKWLANNPNASELAFDQVLDELNNINDLRQYIKDVYKNAKDVNTLMSKLDRLDKLSKGCPEIQKQIDDLKKEINKEMTQRDKKEKKTRSVVSMDPNAIYGPDGVLEERYLTGLSRQSFLITFENMDTASADAQIVEVVVPLDTQAYDLNSFEFSSLSIGSQKIRVPKGRDNFVLTVPMHERGMNVRIMARLDKESGVVRWKFISLDTMSGELPLLDGFLPPNLIAPEGEGSVSFSIRPKPGLADAFVFSNKASIVFDDNEAIETNTWTNILDRLPGSSMTLAAASEDSITVVFSGSDDVSGVGYYLLYLSVNGGDWINLTTSLSDTILLKGEPGTQYDFYSILVDRAGNIELKTPHAESSVRISGINERDRFPVRVYPSPNQGDILYLDWEYSSGPLDIEIFDVLGRRVFVQRIDALHSKTSALTIRGLTAGSYQIRVRDDQRGIWAEEKFFIIR